MIFDILQTIIDNSNQLSDQLNIIQINRHTNENCMIHVLTTPIKMTSVVFRQKKYSRIKKLVHTQGLGHSRGITSVNHLSETLEILICRGEYHIRQRSFNKLKKLRFF